MIRPLITAIMPAYNSEAYLAEAVESVLAQDHDCFEVIVVDDGSTDSTPDILARYPALRVIRQENRGPAAARNTALAAARGDLVATFDADDLWPPHRLSVQARYLAEHHDVGCVLARQEWIDPPPWLTRDPVYGDLDGIPLGSAMIRKTVYDALGGFDASYRRGEDMDLMIRMRERGVRIEVLQDVLWYRRFHGENVTAQQPAVNPLLRSIREKLERTRAAGAVPEGGS